MTNWFAGLCKCDINKHSLCEFRWEIELSGKLWLYIRIVLMFYLLKEIDWSAFRFLVTIEQLYINDDAWDVLTHQNSIQMCYLHTCRRHFTVITVSTHLRPKCHFWDLHAQRRTQKTFNERDLLYTCLYGQNNLINDVNDCANAKQRALVDIQTCLKKWNVHLAIDIHIKVS